MLRLTGAVRVRYDGGEFEAHFDNRSQDAALDNVDVEASVPQLTARTLDVEALRKGARLDIETRPKSAEFAQYFFDKHEPDGLGESRILLSTV